MPAPLRDGRPGSRGDAGAYEYGTAANPGWSIEQDFKVSGLSIARQINKRVFSGHNNRRQSSDYSVYTLQGRMIKMNEYVNYKNKEGALRSLDQARKILIVTPGIVCKP